MDNVATILILVLLSAVLVTQFVLVFRKVTIDLAPLTHGLQSVEKSFDRTDRSLREEIARNREEASSSSRQSREELAATLKGVGDTTHQQLSILTQATDQKLGDMRETIQQRLGAIQEDSGTKLAEIRQESSTATQKARDEVATGLKEFRETLTTNLNTAATSQRDQLGGVLDQLSKLTEKTETKLDEQRISVQSGLKEIQAETTDNAKQMREEVSHSLRDFNESLLNGMNGMVKAQQTQMESFSGKLETLTGSNEQKLNELKAAVEQKLDRIQQDNAMQLEQMRATVDEKLQGTLEKRLGESFKQVSDRLEQVYRGLGEMQALATGVGDLKRVLTNVKARGTWGEVQLGALLEQVLTQEQYATNVATKGGGERVEFAIKFPGPGDDKNEVVWLPLDAKFPMEDYQRLVEAQERADLEAVEASARQLEVRIKQCAKGISEKYLNPPATTDFGILFVPSEGLFAEIIRRPGLTESIQRECRVIIAGPTTLWSILNSLQMGFRTLAIQKRSSEVWNLLAAIKTEWTKYGGILDKVQKKLTEASNTVSEAQSRTRTIGKKLRDVQELPAPDAQRLLIADNENSVDGLNVEVEQLTTQ